MDNLLELDYFKDRFPIESLKDPLTFFDRCVEVFSLSFSKNAFIHYINTPDTRYVRRDFMRDLYPIYTHMTSHYGYEPLNIHQFSVFINSRTTHYYRDDRCVAGSRLDSTLAFAESILLERGEDKKVTIKDLYNQYVNYCTLHNLKPHSTNIFHDRLRVAYNLKQCKTKTRHPDNQSYYYEYYYYNFSKNVLIESSEVKPTQWLIDRSRNWKERYHGDKLPPDYRF